MALVPAGSGASQHGGAVKRLQPGQVTRVAIRDGKTISINGEYWHSRGGQR